MFYGGVSFGGFAGFTGRRLCRGLFFDKVAGLRPAALLKERLWSGYFFCDFSGQIFDIHLQKTGSAFYLNVLKMDLAILISH